MLYSAVSFKNRLERHSSNQRASGWRPATPIANHPPHTGNRNRNPGQGHHFTHPGKPASSFPCCVIQGELSPLAQPPPANAAGNLGFLGHLDGIGLKVENVSHGFHLLSHTSLTKQWGYALQRRLVQESTRAALIEPKGKWLATGDTHRQPPATYGKPEPKPRSRPPFHPSRQTSFLIPVLRDTRRTITTGTATAS